MGHIILQTTAGALSGLLARAHRDGAGAYMRGALASSARVTEREVDAIAAGDELADWAIVRDMAAGVGMAPLSLAWRALARSDGEEMVDHDEDPETPKVVGYRFVMSTDDEDRARDIIAQDWDLSQFTANPVAPWSHDYTMPSVGSWRNVGVHQGPNGAQLRGTLVPLALPSYPLSVTVAEQLRAGVLRSVSVGLYPRAVLSRGSLEQDDPSYSQMGGYYIMGPTLLECSPTPMPMNQNALRLRSAEPAPAPAPEPEPEAPVKRSALPWAQTPDDSHSLPGLPWAR